MDQGTTHFNVDSGVDQGTTHFNVDSGVDQGTTHFNVGPIVIIDDDSLSFI